MGTCWATYRVLRKHKKDAQPPFFTLVSGMLAARRMGRHKKRGAVQLDRSSSYI